MPRPFSGEAIVPATCVPWPFSSTFAGSLQEPSASAAHGPSTSGTSTVKLRLRAASKFGAMSGWKPSMPVSSTPTSTPRLPGSIAYEPETVAWIIVMSHCRPASGSAVGAAARALSPRTAAFSAAVKCSPERRWRKAGAL